MFRIRFRGCSDTQRSARTPSSRVSVSRLRSGLRPCIAAAAVSSCADPVSARGAVDHRDRRTARAGAGRPRPWGVPHIYAQSADDLFFAQGFVQAQDRSFQMDLWRRSVQGRLSDVRAELHRARCDALAACSTAAISTPSGRATAPTPGRLPSAFVRGINAWVERARERRPEEFVVAGWNPKSGQAEPIC